ncbi:hypothetical protein [Tenggerimyces flavus]|uniref:Uncharacterized protein n=1 Tax=Tenggerimyces flavus TaxID=1708749 RepID=A0ABV7YDE0_9ACTN|nr:hypothetical protein [Tenggerimyces flavus]MBM7783323.1 hypothetical protein [Tenggerimyces flavus]
MITRRPTASLRACLWGISAIVGAALVLSSCGGQSPDGSGSDSGSGAKNGEAAEKTPLEPYLGPGGSGLGSGGTMMRAVRAGGNEDNEAEQKAKQRKVEAEVVACMKDAGFDYVANIPKDDVGKAFEEAYSLPPDEFAKKYGYGVATLDHLMPSDEASTDPNQKIREKLSSQAQKAYDKALYGAAAAGVVVDSGSGSTTKSSKPSRKDMEADPGCYGKASEKVYGKQKQFDENAWKKFDSLFKDLEALRKRMENDQRVKDATTAWSDCMADQGYPDFKKPQDAQSSVWDKFSDASKPADGGGEGESSAPAAKPMPMKLDAAKRKEIRELELKLAPIDYECQQKTFVKAAKEVQIELEKEFLEQHKTQLEQYRDMMAEMGMNVTGGVG